MAPRQCDQLLFQKKNRNNLNPREQEFIKFGEIVCDVNKKKWRLGKPVGLGAFGDIYSISDDFSRSVPSDSKYVCKMEPHTNGPLFVEMNFYLRAAKESQLQEWKESRRMAFLGMPHIISFGSHWYKGTKMRFIIMPKYNESINKMLVKHSHQFHIKTALTLAVHTMDVLEYIHSQGYIHSDIKASNMVLGDGSNQAPVYLIDFGLASKYVYEDGTHKGGNPDGRKADAGTLEFSSRDAHLGVISRRSDMESLGYNLVSWLGGKLPWINCLVNSDLVLKQKEDAMTNIARFISNTTSKFPLPNVIEQYFSYVTSLGFNTKPNYTYCRRLFRKAITEAGYLDDNKLMFGTHAKLNKKIAKKRVAERENIIPPKKMKPCIIGSRKPCAVHNYNSDTMRITRNLDRGKEFISTNFNWASILAGHPERDLKIKKETPMKLVKLENQSAPKSKKNNLSNPTPAMLKVMDLRKQHIPQKRSRSDSSSTSSGLTPAMEEVIANRCKQGRVLRSAMKKNQQSLKHWFKTKCKYSS